MSIGYKLADLHIGLGPAQGAPNLPTNISLRPWATSLTFVQGEYVTNAGYLLRASTSGSQTGNTTGDGPSQGNLVDANETWVAVAPLNPLYAQDAAATVPLGTVAKIVSPDFGEGEAIYVKFTGTVVAGDTCVYNLYGSTAVVAPTTVVNGSLYGIAFASQSSGTFGWLMIKGVHGAASVANGTPAGMLGTSGSVAGQLVVGVNTTGISSLNLVMGANCRLAPVGALAFAAVEVRYPTPWRGA